MGAILRRSSPFDYDRVLSDAGMTFWYDSTAKAMDVRVYVQNICCAHATVYAYTWALFYSLMYSVITTCLNISYFNTNDDVMQLQNYMLLNQKLTGFFQ